MSELAKSVTRGNWRYSAFGILLSLLSQSLCAQSTALPSIYFPRAVFQCAEHRDLETCSAEDLKKVGWTDLIGAKEVLDLFTSRVLAEALSQEPRFKQIKASPDVPLKDREQDLVNEWRSKGAHEATRPWIIEVKIRVDLGHCYSFAVQARRAGQQDVSYEIDYQSPNWEEFYKVGNKHFPSVAKCFSKVGQNILGLEPSDER